MSQPENITINGISYPLSSLSDVARGHLTSIQAVDAEIMRLQVQLGIARTARNAYVNALGVSVSGAADAVKGTAD